MAPEPAIASRSCTSFSSVADLRAGTVRDAGVTDRQGVIERMSGQQGREVVIVEAVRTPIGRGHQEKGYYKDTHPNDLLGRTYTEVLDRAGVDASEVEDVIAGCVAQFGEQGLNVARNAWLQEGLPIEAAATTVDRQCGSAQQAVNFGAALIASGIHDVVIGSGVEHMGHISFGATMETQKTYGTAFTEKLLAKHNIVGQGLGAEMIADQWEIPRSELDELALRSHRLAAKATEEGRFEREIVPFRVNGDTYVADQGIRPDTTLEALAGLKPAFKPDGKITAGNSSQISDGAAAVLLMSREKADELGLRARARIVDQTTVGVDPVTMLTGPIPATQKILDRNGMRIGDCRHGRDQRGLRPGRGRLAARARAGPRPREPARRRDGARPSAGLDRRAAHHDAAARARGRGQGARPRHDVLRRWPGHRDADPAGLSATRAATPRAAGVLSAAEARRMALRAQGLLGAPDRRGGVPALLERLARSSSTRSPC
jgi:acetyl-CoA acetyltransferase family protein